VRIRDALGVTTATGRGGSIDMPSARITCNLPDAGRSKPAHRSSQAVSNSTSQTVASKHAKTDTGEPTATIKSLQHAAYIGSGENDKRYRHHHLAS
jgi:hypothetical protein